MPAPKSRTPLETARWQLATVWFGGSGIIALILFVQSLLGAFGQHVQQVWGWAVPNILPSLSLMMIVFVGTALVDDPETDKMAVRTPFLRLCLGLSGFHLLCVALVILLQPFMASRTPDGQDFDPMASFTVANLLLGPLQGLVAAALGALFFTKSQRAAGAHPSAVAPPASTGQ